MGKKIIIGLVILILLAMGGIFYFISYNLGEQQNQESEKSLTGTQKYAILNDIGGYTLLSKRSLYGYLGQDYHNVIYNYNNKNASVFVRVFYNDSAMEGWWDRKISGMSGSLNDYHLKSFGNQEYYQVETYPPSDFIMTSWKNDNFIIEVDTFKSDSSLFEAYMEKYS